MYEAKHEMSVVRFYRADRDPNSRELLAGWSTNFELQSRHEPSRYYQPTLELRSASAPRPRKSRFAGSTRRGGIDPQPDSFIPLAERVGLIPDNARLAVLEQAIGKAARLDARGHPLQISINVYATTWSTRTYLSTSTCCSNGMACPIIASPSRSPNPRSATTLIAWHGVYTSSAIVELRVSIDDYGVGYSSMSQLLGLHIDELKIDKSFVLALETDRRGEAIIRSAVELGQALDLTVVAEGIESAEALRLVRRLGRHRAGLPHLPPVDAILLDDYLAEPAHHHGLLPERAIPNRAASTRRHELVGVGARAVSTVVARL